MVDGRYGTNGSYGINFCKFIHRNSGFYPQKQVISPQELSGLSVGTAGLSTGNPGLSTEIGELSTTYRP